MMCLINILRYHNEFGIIYLIGLEDVKEDENRDTEQHRKFIKARRNFSMFSVCLAVPRETWRHGLTRHPSSKAFLLSLAGLRDYQARRVLKLANSHPSIES